MAIRSVQYENVEIEYELIRKDVKYINLRVNKKGEVVVSAPKKAPLNVIDEFVQSKAFWIIMHLAEIEQIKQSMPRAGLYDGKTVYFLGKPFTLILQEGMPSISFEDDEIVMFSQKKSQEELQEEFQMWLKEEAKPIFDQVIDETLPILSTYGIKRPTVSIRNMKSIWGSCTVGGESIRLNLRLMRFPIECLEMVVLHELLHFKFPNHGDDFYQAMTKHMPDWKERKQKLESKQFEY